ncbi:MAG: hypothetical protein JW889_07605 [Verrucomicrobia bacterium]|nr:hypothetical protein [Verrucomicrobiota bacterium]
MGEPQRQGKTPVLLLDVTDAADAGDDPGRDEGLVEDRPTGLLVGAAAVLVDSVVAEQHNLGGVRGRQRTVRDRVAGSPQSF